jgi:hypothetical protein
MRKQKQTVASFWQRAARSLPAHVASRYSGYFEQAERWELALDAVIELGARAKSNFGRAFHTPRSA